MASSTPHSSTPRDRVSSGVRSNSASSSSTTVPQSAASPISVDILLAKYSTSSNPHVSALQQAVGDYNNLASQNSQLWKLIEKQRNGYNQIMKELERVRSERDGYKARLHSVSPPSLDHHTPRRHRTSETEKIQTTSNSSHTLPAKSEQKPQLTRLYSDEQSTPTQPHVHSSYQDQNGVYSPDHPPRTSSRNVDAHQTTHPPTESLAVLASGTSAQEKALFSRHHSGSDASLPSFLSAESSGRPSLADDGNSLNPSIVLTEHRSRSYSNASGSAESSAPPQSAPVGYNTISPQTIGPPPHSAPPPTNSALLAVSRDDVTNRSMSRDSHVSLPDEARNYITNMADSPLTSPRADGSFSQSPRNFKQPLPKTINDGDRADDFLDLEDVGEDSDDDENAESSQNDFSGKEQPLVTNSQPRPFMTPERPTKPQIEDVNPSFRSLPLLPHDLPYTQIRVSTASVRPNDRGKDVLSFSVYVKPGPNKESWRINKLYSDIISLDQRVRASVSKSVLRKIATLPEPKLWKDHAPVKVDQRKAALETYLQSLISLPVAEKHEIIAFLTSDVAKEARKPVVKAGYKEGYLTKRGKNFGGWKSRFFVLAGPELEYYESRGGGHLGTIQIAGAQIGRQQRATDKVVGEDEKEYRHAFLIVEAKKGPGGNHPRHVLCADSDAERDSWVQMLVRYFSGTYNEETSPLTWAPPETPPRSSASTPPPQHPSLQQTEISSANSTPRRPARTMSKDDVRVKGTAIPISQLTPDQNNAKLFQTATYDQSGSPSKSVVDPSAPSTNFSDAQTAKRMLEHGMPSSLPDSSPLTSQGSALLQTDTEDGLSQVSQRANSEQGHYSDLETKGRQSESPQQLRTRDPPGSERKARHNAAASGSASIQPERGGSPDKMDKVKISAPLNGAPIPVGYKFGRETPPESSPSNDRREKAKSRSFWGFGRPMGDKPSQPGASASRGPVFGIPLEDSLEVAKIANLPAIVFRCIQYLETQKADQEEGIYRLSGSSAVIKSLKDRFNAEGDVDLMASDDFWDPHAVAGLLKSFLRDLPSSILTRELHMRFLAVMDFADTQERIHELANLISALPLANYTLLRALTAHLILIVQNAGVNKMTVRNVGIVFNPTLGIPAGVFSLMLGEFNRVFNVDNEASSPIDPNDAKRPQEPLRRNSQQYCDGAADQMLGLGGRSLPPNADESDTDDVSINGVEISDTEEGGTLESATTQELQEAQATRTSKAANTAASRGLNVSVSERGNRHSRIMGLPLSPRPSPSPSTQKTPTQH